MSCPRMRTLEFQEVIIIPTRNFRLSRVIGHLFEADGVGLRLAVLPQVELSVKLL